MRSCFLSSFVEFCSAVSEEKSKMSQPIRGQGGHLVFPIGPKNTNSVENVEILLPVKFRWIPFSSFRGEVENVSANQRPGWPSCFSDRPEKHKLGRGCWVLDSCQVSLNSVKWYQRRSRKCEKLTKDGRTDRRTDEGQRVITIVHLSLRLRCTKNWPYHSYRNYYCFIFSNKTEWDIVFNWPKPNDGNKAKRWECSIICALSFSSTSLRVTHIKQDSNFSQNIEELPISTT